MGAHRLRRRPGVAVADRREDGLVLFMCLTGAGGVDAEEGDVGGGCRLFGDDQLFQVTVAGAVRDLGVELPR